MAGRFSHLDFDDLPEKQEPAPAPLAGGGWNSGSRWRDLALSPKRIELPMGRGVFSYFEESPSWLYSKTSTPGSIPMISPKQIEFNVSTLDEPAFDSIRVQLGLRHQREAWEYHQITLSYDAVRGLSFETPVLRKVFARGYAVMVAIDPRARDGVRAYVESDV